MNATITREYKRERKTGTRAAFALRAAKTRYEFQQKECGEHDAPELGSVRLRIVPDDSADLSDLLGDTYNPEVNDDIQPSRLEREKKQEIERIEREGVCGVIGEYYDGNKWQHVDSCFGFVGEDWKGSGYDVDIMRATLDKANHIETCPTCGQALPEHD